MEKAYRLYNDIGSGDSKSLLDAIINNDCKYLINEYEIKGNLNIIDNKGENLLHKAARFKHYEVVDLLIILGLDVNLKNNHKDTPLHIATQFKSEEIVQKLIDSGADINCVNSQNVTPLIIASSLGYDNILTILLENKAKINISSENGMLPIHYGVKSGKTSILRTLLNYGASLLDCDDRGNNVLHLACLYNNYDLITFILRNITIINNINMYKETALHIACLYCGVDCVALLIKYGFNPNIKNGEGKTAIDISLENGRDDVSDYITNYVNSKDYKNHFAYYSLHEAVINSNYQYIYEKVNTKIVNDYDYFGKSMLCYAILLKDYQMIDLLYRKGARLTNLDDFNQSALALAIFNNDNDLARYFLYKGSNPNEIYNNHSLLYYAIIKGNYELVKLLIIHGADINYLDNHHRSIYSYAMEYASDEIIDLLINNQK